MKLVSALCTAIFLLTASNRAYAECTCGNTEQTPASAGSFVVDYSMMDRANPAAAADNCANPASEYPDECTSNKKAVDSINTAINRYGFTNRGQIVAVVANMLYESGYWVYNRRHFPYFIPGQGTRSMMDFSYVWQYARHFYPGTPWEQILPDPNNASDEAKNKTLDYVIGNDESFGSGFWFMKEMRPEFFNSGEPKENDEQSFRNYVLNGVKADSSDIERRVSVWHTVNNAFVAKQA